MKFYVYAGYYEQYISTKPMDPPRVFERYFLKIENAIKYAESFNDTVIYCRNVEQYLPEGYPHDAIEENNEFYEF